MKNDDDAPHGDLIEDMAEHPRRPGAGADRRKKVIPVAVERRSGKDRRELEGTRRNRVDPTTCEKDYSDEEIEFMKSMDLYKRHNRRPFPTWSEVLEVMHAIGYRKTEAATPIPGVPVPKGPLPAE